MDGGCRAELTVDCFEVMDDIQDEEPADLKWCTW